MGRRPWIVVALAAVLAAMLVPGSAVSVVQHSDDGDSAEFDVRTGVAAPTAAQRTAVKRLGATVIWNRFGTPASLSKRGKFLATGMRGANAVAAARAWLNANKAILGLSSTAGLVLDADTRLAASNGHAVNFRQVFDGLEAAEGGLVTVGITGSAAKRWRVAYVSSSLTRSTSLVSGEIQLSPAEGLAQAAQAAGDGFSIAKVTQAKDAAGYESFKVSGLDSLQHVKLVSFPTPKGGVLPAYESLVVNKDAGEAYRIYVDARDGRLLARFPAVFNLADQELVPVTIPFSGTLPTTPNSCAPRHGPFVVGSGVRFLRVFANADNPGQDILLRLYRDAAIVAQSDVGFTPEAIQYAPTGGVPAGNYFAEVCAFGTPIEPRTYTGTFTIDDSPAPAPYLSRWKVFPANPPLAPILGDPWGNPSTDTRETWCWDAGEAAELRQGRRQPRLARAVGPQRQGERSDADDDRATTRSPRRPGRTPMSPSPPQLPADEPEPRLPVPVDERLVQRRLRADAGQPRARPGTTRRRWRTCSSPTTACTTWRTSSGFTERNWNAQDINFGLTENWQQNDPVIGDSQAGAPRRRVRDNANMTTLPDGPVGDHEHVLLAGRCPARSIRPASTATTTWA